jgi:EmrB/QacA subfamily drug resistance transporter
MADVKNITVSKNTILLISVIFIFVNSIIFSSLNIMLPTIGKEFAAGSTLLGWVVNGPILITAATLLPFGRIADIYGRKKLFLIGSFLLTLAFLLDGVASSITLLICYQIIQGIGNGMTIGVSVAILTSVFPPNERGKALGIYTAAVYIGSSVGPYLCGVMTQYLGWRSCFLLGAVLLLFVSLLILFKIKGDWADARGEKFDIIGSIMLGISIILLIYGFTMVPKLQGIILIAVSLVGIAVFIQWEKRISSPLLDLNLFLGNRAFVFSNLATVTNFCANMAGTFLLSFYLQYIEGFTPSKAGLILLVQPIFMAIFAPIAGRLSDRIEPRKIATAGLSLVCIALFIYSYLTESHAIWLLIIALAVHGLGNAFFSSPNTNAIMSAVEKKYFGIASGTVSMMRNIGFTLGMSMIMIIFSIYIGDVQITSQYYPAFQTSMRIGFIAFSVIVLSGVFAQIAGKNKKSAISAITVK